MLSAAAPGARWRVAASSMRSSPAALGKALMLTSQPWARTYHGGAAGNTTTTSVSVIN